MTKRIVRKNPGAIRWLRAAFIAGTAATALSATGFYPDWLMALAALGCFGLALWTPAVALLLAVAALAVPVAAADFVAGAALCVIGFALAQSLSSRDAAGALALVVTLVTMPLGAGFAGPVLAGYLFGLRDGALGAGLGVASAIATGAALGAPRIGVVMTGAVPSRAAVTLGQVPAEPLAFRWLADSIAHADPARLLDALTGVGHTPVLVGQILAWVAVAAAASWLRGADHSTKDRLRVVSGLALLAALASGLGAAVWRLGDHSMALADLASTAGASVGVAALVGFVSEWLFPRMSIAQDERLTAPASLRTEEADVDELLRLIASAEEELASRHTKNAVVMLTDLKAFSQMTERLGSVECAKVVQRHRDVLLPIIERHGGRGKPTGGDGLVAAFEDAASAVDAATQMQKALEGLDSTSAVPEGLAIRIGIASGEVVVDAGGRPFLGAALNLAARVMGLADGGRIFVSGDVARSAGRTGIKLHSHGEFALKNIARPVEVVEVLWKDGLTPQPIATTDEGTKASGSSTDPDA